MQASGACTSATTRRDEAPQTSVAEVKEQIWAKVGIPVVEQRLLFAGRELSSEEKAFCAASLQLVRVGSDPRHSDLAYFRAYADLQPLLAGSFTTVKGLRNAIHGKIFLARWHREGQNDERIVVKKMPTAKVNQHLGKETS